MPQHRPPLPVLAAPFVVDTVLKRDVFGEIAAGHLADAPDTPVTRRRVGSAARWVRRFAWHLAGREIRALQTLGPVAGTPTLLGVDSEALYRSWIEGTPLHVARPVGNTAYFRDAKRLLRSLHRAGITHNDLAKPQNWLMTPDGKAALIDMQLATFFPRRTRLFRLLAREDLRHLLKHKRSFCREALTASEKRMLATKSLPARVWMATFKPVYNMVTRGIFNWSDGEGTRDRMDTDGVAIKARAAADPAIHTRGSAAARGDQSGRTPRRRRRRRHRPRHHPTHRRRPPQLHRPPLQAVGRRRRQGKPPFAGLLFGNVAAARRAWHGSSGQARG